MDFMDFEETTGPAKEGKVKILSEQLVSDPTSLVFASLADMYREGGMLEEAMTMCQAGLAIHPHHIPGQLVLAKIYRDDHRSLEALEALEKVLALEPGNPEAIALLESLESQFEGPSAAGPSEGLPAGQPLEVVSTPQAPAPPLNGAENIEVIPESQATESPIPLVAKPSEEEVLTIEPGGEVSAVHEVPQSPSEEQTPLLSPAEIEHATLGFEPGAIIQDSWVISRPIEMEYPGEAPTFITPAPETSTGTSSTLPVTEERAPVSSVSEPAPPVSEKEPLLEDLQVPLAEHPSVLSSQVDGETPAELPMIGSVFTAPPAPPEVPRVPEEPKKHGEELSLAEFMKSLSGAEFMELPRATVAEGVAAKPEVSAVPSDEMRREMEKALDDLLTLDEVEGAMVVNRDGLVLAERTRTWINAEEAAALAASIYETTAYSLGRMQMGQLDRGIVETSLGQLYFISLGEALLVLLTRDNTKMGLILMQVKKVLKRIQRVVQ